MYRDSVYSDNGTENVIVTLPMVQEQQGHSRFL